MTILVIGIGQNLRGDDAAGLEAVRRWQANYPETASRPKVRVEMCELPGLGLLSLLYGMKSTLIVDAVQASAPPGTLLHITPTELASFTAGTRSAHGWGVAETLELGRSLNPSLAGCEITLLGIVIGQVEMGTGLSPEVEANLDKAAERINTEVLGSLERTSQS